MVNLSKRSYQKELLDATDIPFDAIKQNMKELNVINTLLGGHSISISGLEKIAGQRERPKPLLICEIGCGGGDNLAALDKWCKQKNIAASFIGIDIKKECVDFAVQQYPLLSATWVEGDYRNVFFERKPDIIFCSLFCHHFNEDEIKEMLQWMKVNATAGFFINDLHRHILAYCSISLLTKIFSKSYLVKNDAPLSVKRGFTKAEWQMIFRKAGIDKFSLQWKWAFRHLIIFRHGQ
jgi:SAM-dependent methyltransferase